MTGRIVEELEAGRIPWVQPWDAAGFAPGLPKNADTHRSYSGINILILWAEAARRGFAPQEWLTFRQALAAGGAVRKGETGTTIFYAARFTPHGGATGAGDGSRGPGEGGGSSARGGGAAAGGAGASEAGAGSAVPFLKRFTVFNVAQCEGLPDRCTRAAAPMPPREIIPHAEALIAATGADIRIGGNEAYYHPGGDYVALPPQQAFRAQIDYYRTVLHELGHWTGHPSRLARDQRGGFASAAYGREELCAELASAFLCAALAIQPTVRHADYIGAWLGIMRADTRAIFKAASHASKAADYLLGFAPNAARGAAAATVTAATCAQRATDAARDVDGEHDGDVDCDGAAQVREARA
nr:zincin-like metallopeptidase domain-containing protein [Sphingopyxis sp.]